MAEIVLKVVWRSVAISLVAAVPVLMRRRLAGLFPSRALAALWLVLALCLVIPLPSFSWPVYRPMAPKLSEVNLSDNASSPAAQDPEHDVDAGVLAQAAAPRAAGPMSVQAATPKLGKLDPVTVLAAIWLVGAAILFCRESVCAVGYRRRLSRWACRPDHRVETLYRGLAAELGIARPPGLHMSHKADSPVTVGLLNPAIFLPAGIELDGLELMMLHELGHYQRRDIPAKWLLLVARAIHWFNPLAHLLGRLYEGDSELACDQLVLARLAPEQKRDYGLLLLAELTAVQPHGALTTGFRTDSAEIKRRFQAILTPSIKRSGRWLLCLMLCLGMLSGLLAGAESPYEHAGLSINGGQGFLELSRTVPHSLVIDPSWPYVDLEGADLRTLNLAEHEAALMQATFDANTLWPQSLPEGFDPQAMLAWGKDPGLGVRSLHEAGLTGAGVTVAIVGSPLYIEHPEYRDRLVHYEELAFETPPSSAMSFSSRYLSVIAGQTVGVAPGADVIYVAIPYADESGKIIQENIALGLERVLDLNDKLPQAQKVRVIYLQMGWFSDQPGYEAAQKALSRARKAGVLVAGPSMAFDYGLLFCGASREWLADPDNPASYSMGRLWQGFGIQNIASWIAVPNDARTAANAIEGNGYTFYPGEGGSMPPAYIAGLYALAAQIDHQVTPNTFWQAASATATPLSRSDRGTSAEKLINPTGLMLYLQENRE